MPQPLRVYPFTLTDVDVASEHAYARRLFDALTQWNVITVDSVDAADVVHLFEVNWYTGAALQSFNYPELLRALVSDTPVVVSTDDLYFSKDPSLTAHPRLYPLNHYTQRLLLNGCDAVIAISESVRNRLTPSVDPQMIHVIHHGVDDKYRTDVVHGSGDPFVLHVSLAAPRKNPDVVREAARRLESRFVVAGSGWDEYIPDTAAFDNVELKGYVPEDELVDLYKRAGIFYFPTRHEGFGLPIIEAMAAGNAVVTSNVYAVPEVADDAAILCNPDDIDAHLDHLSRLLTRPDERIDLAEKAIGWSRQFTWEKAAAETIDVYRTVL